MNDTGQLWLLSLKGFKLRIIWMECYRTEPSVRWVVGPTDFQDLFLNSIILACYSCLLPSPGWRFYFIFFPLEWIKHENNSNLYSLPKCPKNGCEPILLIGTDYEFGWIKRMQLWSPANLNKFIRDGQFYVAVLLLTRRCKCETQVSDYAPLSRYICPLPCKIG